MDFPKDTIGGPPGSPPDRLVKVQGRVRMVCTNPDGSTAWEDEFGNEAVYAGLNYLLNTGFRGTTQSSSWYVGLIDNTGFAALSISDTMSAHSGWSESTAYSQSNRVQWSPGAAASGSLTNSTAMTFSINGTVSVKGIFVADNNTKGGSSGTLWATAVESSARSLTSGQTLSVYYTVTLTPA